MRPIHRTLPLLVAAVLAGLAVGGNSGPSAPPAAVQVALTEVAAHGRDWLGRELRMQLQVESQPETWNPYLTRFGTEDYRAVIAWGDEQDLWLREHYEHPAAMLFARRGTRAEAALARAGRYARIDAVGTVRQVFAGRPWIELTELTVLPEQFTTGSMVHASRGMELMAAEHWVLAAQSFERALASDVPERARTELDRLRSDCLGRAPQPIPLPIQKKRN